LTSGGKVLATGFNVCGVTRMFGVDFPSAHAEASTLLAWQNQCRFKPGSAQDEPPLLWWSEEGRPLL